MSQENEIFTKLNDAALDEHQVSGAIKVSKALLRKHRRLGIGIPYVKIGHSVRYLVSDVQKYLEQQRVTTKN